MVSKIVRRLFAANATIKKGPILDMPVKQTIACNEAVLHAAAAIKNVPGAVDRTPPSIWAPQRLPWNPGGYGAGALWRYQYTKMNTSFHVRDSLRPKAADQSLS